MIKSEVVNRGIDYIITNLNEDISIEDVARHCNYSKYYFSRLFKQETGESIYAFIKRLKINQSAISLQIENGKSITDIGLDYGYDSSNYSNVFQKHHHTSPSKFRRLTKNTYKKNPFYQDHMSCFHAFEAYEEKVSIQTWDDFPVIYERHIGNYIELKDKWGQFIEKYASYISEHTRFIERSYDDPAITDLDRCIYDMCCTVKPDCPLCNITTIKGGRYAVYPYEGPVEKIYSAVQGLLHGWLPSSGYETADRYGLNIYRVMDTRELYVEMDICFPIK